MSYELGDMSYELGDFSTQVPDCLVTPPVSSCVGVVVVASTSPDFITYVSLDPVDNLPACPLPSLPSHSLECPNLLATDYHDALKGKVSDCIWSLGTFQGYDPPFDPFHDYLVDMPRKIIWTAFFDHSFDFSEAYDTIMRALSFIGVFFPVFSYIHHSRMHAGVYDRLLRALTASEW